MLNEQAKVSDSEQPKLLSTDISDKMDELKREIGYLTSKIKYFRPKKKATEKTTNKTNDTSNSETDDFDKQESSNKDTPTEKEHTEQNENQEDEQDQSLKDKNQQHSQGKFTLFFILSI